MLLTLKIVWITYVCQLKLYTNLARRLPVGVCKGERNQMQFRVESKARPYIINF